MYSLQSDSGLIVNQIKIYQIDVSSTENESRRYELASLHDACSRRGLVSEVLVRDQRDLIQASGQGYQEENPVDDFVYPEIEESFLQTRDHDDLCPLDFAYDALLFFSIDWSLRRSKCPTRVLTPRECSKVTTFPNRFVTCPKGRCVTGYGAVVNEPNQLKGLRKNVFVKSSLFA